MEYEEIKKLYEEFCPGGFERAEKLPGSGSSRHYYRVFGKNGESVIATLAIDDMDNKAFRHLSDVFRKSGTHVPAILAYDESIPQYYLQSDHGSVSLMDLIARWQKSELDRSLSPEEKATIYREMIDCLRLAIIELIKIQKVDRSLIDEDKIYPPFSRRQIMWDLNYFKYDFMKPSGIEFNESALEDDFERLANSLCEIPETLCGFMYRDFQSRNIMVEPGEVTLIDFQGGRFGPVVYDIVSLLWQAKARFPKHIRQEMTDFYIEKYSETAGANIRKDMKRLLPKMVLFRTLQVLGAYGFRGLIEKKAHFIESIPFGLDNLNELLIAGELSDYPELEKCCRQLVAQRERYVPEQKSGSRLRVEVFSFSYKKGYPTDFSGNGGGFMFDCRGMHNPGRYDEYKPLTGLDKPVIDFLEERGEVQQFLSAASRMVEPAVECYRRRGFTNLQIGFGCTGGRHRSVYCAQHLAESLAQKFPDVEIDLCHREQGISKIYNSGICNSDSAKQQSEQ